MSGYDHLSRSSPGGSRTFVALGFGLFMVAVLIGVVSFNRSKAVKSGFGAGLAGRWFLDAERPVDLLGWCGFAGCRLEVCWMRERGKRGSRCQLFSLPIFPYLPICNRGCLR